jgi:DNA gyrase subunit A
MVQRTNVRGIRQTGRAAQGVTLMNVRDEDRVSAVALVVESEGTTAAAVSDEALAAGPVELSAGVGESKGLPGGADAGSNGAALSDGVGLDDDGFDGDGAGPEDEEV